MCIEDTAAAIDAVTAAGARRVAPPRLLDGRRGRDRRGRPPGGRPPCSASPRGSPTGSTSRGLDGQAARRPPRRLGPLPAGDPRRQPGELTPRLRARAGARASRASYELIPRALHPIAVRAPWGAALPAPRAAPLGRARRRGARPLSGLRGLNPAPRHLLRRRPPHVPDEPELLEAADDRSTTCRPASGGARGGRSSGRRGGCCASPRRGRARRRPSCCAPRRASA